MREETKTFLYEKAMYIMEQHPNDMEDFAIIIPNKRAAVYLQKYFAEKIGKPFFSPEILTINEWIDRYTPQRIVSQVELLFVLYKIHKEIEQKEAEDFNEFIKWGKIILSDFDEIDRYLIPPRLIFRDLRNIKEIENWSFLEAELSKGQEAYMTLWDKLPRYYQLFKKEMNARSICYQGMAYQRFHDTLRKDGFQENWKNKYYFIGFNALSASEEGIFRHLVAEKQAEVFFDIDKSYYENDEHEAGHFYRKLRKRWPIKKEISTFFNDHPKEIQVIETAQQLAQSKIGGNKVDELLKSGADLGKTAIVLADESLLIPLTRSLPASIETANITMGYPIKFSHLKSLVDALFELQFNFVKFNSDRVYYKSILSLLDHPYLAAIVGDEEMIRAFEEDLVSKNKIFVDLHDLITAFPIFSSVKYLFQLWKNPAKDGFVAFNELIRTLYEVFKPEEGARQIDLEIIYHFSKGFKRFEEITEAYPYLLNLKTFKQLFYQFWQSESLSFLGNPIDGLQVMGILETRTLDFENLILLGMNEGNLPKTNISNSFIPRDLKLHHNLPVEEDRQAIFAHHFYRLLHRAKRITFTYNSSTEGVGGAERSRFLIQLENELDYTAGHTFEQFTFSAEDKGAEIKKVKYTPTESIKKRLDERLSSGLSPSALNKLVQCPLDFYYRYILGMKETSGVEEHVESSTFGTKIHDVLERIFKENFLIPGRPLDEIILQKERKNIKRYLREAYLEDFSENDLKFGQNKLSFEVSIGFIDQFLVKQIEEIKRTDHLITIIDLEKTISATYNWEINGVQKTIKIEGNADRIEQFGDYFRIIDYKSGKCVDDKISLGDKILNSEEMQKFMRHDNKGYARQLLMYALMFRQTYPQYTQFTAGIISMININDWFQKVYIKKSTEHTLSNELLDAFEEELKMTLSELYQDDFSFEHNPKAKFCEHCDS